MGGNFQKRIEDIQKSDSYSAKKLKELFKEKLSSLDEEDYNNLITSEIRREENHLSFINSVISLFFSCKSLGYNYITVDPLYKIGEDTIKNFDILFAKYGPDGAKVLLVEIKSSISNIGKEVKDFEETKKIYYEKIDFFKKLVGEDIIDAEFVFGVPLSFKDDCLKHIQENKLDLKEFILWSIDPFVRNIKEIKQGSDHKEERKNKRVHQDSDLDPLFKGQPFTNLSPISITVQGHIVKILTYVYEQLYHSLKQKKSITDEDKFVFHEDELKLFISDYRGTNNLTDEQKKSFCKLILDMGEQYLIFKKMSSNTYKLRNTNNPYSINKKLFKEYVNQKMNRDAENQALEEFDASQTHKQKSLGDF